MKRFITTCAVLLTVAATAAAEPAALPPGQTVAEFIETLRDAGHRIVYSSRLVPPDLPVTVAPQSGAPINALLEILQAHGLTLRADEDVFVVVMPERQPETERPAAPAPASDTGDLEKIVVSASRYEILRDVSPSQFLLDRRSIQNMPDVGEDPIRITQRLPGAAASGASARAHFRGGEQGEVGIILNGQRLFDPFHIRDYQNVFSAIDARAIEGVEVFTGGFPVRFGDRMSGLVVMNSLDAEAPRHTEIGLSVFNTSLLHSVKREQGQWLVSARRGNLDLVIDPAYGRPAYYDLFSHASLEIGHSTTVSANALFADDRVTVVLETEPAEREQADSATRNAQLWLESTTDWSDDLSSLTALSYIDYRNRRNGIINDAEKMIASVADDRDIREIGFRQDWKYRPTERHLLQWGFAIRSARADYAYAGSAAYFGLPAVYAGVPDSLERSATASPDGGAYSLYFADRRRFAAKLIVEFGLRWDDQTYTDLPSDAQLSPRLNLLYRWRPGTDLRLSWGRYHQSQGIQELQVEDGITNFWPAQRADHLIAGITHRAGVYTTLRFEAFYKDMQNVRPRFENLHDPLALIPELSPDRVRLEPTTARSRGIEFSFDGARGHWSWWGAYTLSKATDRIDGRDVLRSWDQRHALQAGFGWSNETWNVALAAGAHSGWPTTDLALVDAGVDADGEPVVVAVPGPRNARRHNRFASLDFRVSRHFDLRRGSLSAFFEVSNLANRRNVCCIDWDLDENAAGEPVLEYSLDYWLPLLPAVGVLWEF